MRETVDSLVADIGVDGWPDLVNGTFEMIGGFFILLSIIKLYEDKQVRGISWLHASFFAVWGYWNLFYYPHLEQMWSFWGGVGIVTTNTIWLAQLIYYTRRTKRLTKEWREDRNRNRWLANGDSNRR